MDETTIRTILADSREEVAQKYASAAVLCTFFVCVTTLILGLTAILNG